MNDQIREAIRLSKKNPDTIYEVYVTSESGAKVEAKAGSELEEIGWRGVPSRTVARFKNGQRVD